MTLRFLLSLLSVAVASSVSGQPTYRFEQFRTERGLSQSTVTAITQDHQGFLWIGTDDGLNRFDGHSFTVYRHALEDDATLPGSRITSLHVDEDGELWVGTMSGLARFDRKTETFVTPPGAPGDSASPCTQDVTSLAPDPDGSLWMGLYSGGLCALSPDRQSSRHVPVVSPDPEASFNGTQSRVYTLRVDADGAPWAQLSTARSQLFPACRIDSATGLCDFTARFVGVVPHTSDVFTDGIVPEILRVATRETAIRLPISSENAFREQNLLALPDGRVWIGTESQGLLSVNPTNGRMTSIRPIPDDSRSLAGESVRALFRDRQGNVWIGTTSGLNRWHPPDSSRFRTFRRGPAIAGGLSDERVSGVLEARDGTVWVATRDGLNRIDPETGELTVVRREADGPYANAFWYLYEDSEGILWIGTKRRGLHRLLPGSSQIEPVNAFEGSRLFDGVDQQSHIRFVGEDRRGHLWVGAETGFSVRTPDGRWHPFLEPMGPIPLPSARVNVFFEDRHDRLWVGTDGGLCRLLPESRVPDDLRFHCYTHEGDDPTSLGSDIIWSITEDGRGDLWVGTVGGGLARYDPSTDAFVRLTTQDGLPNNTVYALLADHSGILWTTTNAGLARIDPVSGAVTVYTTADGLPGNEFGFMAYDVGPSGTVYVGGPQGLVMFDPNELITSRRPGPVAVTGAMVFDQRIPGLFDSGDTLRLQHDQNFFRLTFAALDFRTPERARYRYRLAGYESEWRRTLANAPEAAYTRVPPGRYIFEVMALDPAGGSTEPTRLYVIVEPALWQTMGFQGGLAMLALSFGLLGIGVAYRRRQRELEREEAEATELKRRVAEGRERERLRLARELHDGPVQDLYRLGHDLDRLRLRSAEDNPTALLGARAQVTAVATNLREVLATLRPALLPHLGLEAAMDALARRMRRRMPGLEIRLALDTDIARALRPDVQNAVYRIAQEALTNVVKHAGATSATMTLEQVEGGVELVVRDDGRGFEPPLHLLDLARAEHFGLVGAAERLDVVGGRLGVQSSPGRGTTVRAWVPLAVREAEEGG
ncbi:MAG: two-component regulator propeller domain-containing protein [Bacteroidota bacterium]